MAKTSVYFQIQRFHCGIFFPAAHKLNEISILSSPEDICDIKECAGLACAIFRRADFIIITTLSKQIWHVETKSQTPQTSENLK